MAAGGCENKWSTAPAILTALFSRCSMPFEIFYIAAGYPDVARRSVIKASQSHDGLTLCSRPTLSHQP
jgi:hypothetical protein